MKFRNNDPQGDLNIDGVGFVEAGATFEAEGEAAKHFESVPDLFPRADKKRATTDEKPASQATEE